MPESEEWPEGRPEAAQRGSIKDVRAGSAPAAARIAQQHLWVDLQVKQAIERGEFDDLPGAGKPIESLGAQHDPDWWVKQLVERERITVLPASLQLRKDDAELDDRLDRLGSEREVREQVEEFNARVIRARYSPAEGPPLITMPRDVEETVSGWHQRRALRRTTATTAEPPRRPRRRWWRRRNPRTSGRDAHIR